MWGALLHLLNDLSGAQASGFFIKHKDSEYAPLVKNQGQRQRNSEAKCMSSAWILVSKRHSAQKEKNRDPWRNR